MEKSPRRISLRLIFGVATVLGIFSGLQAFNYVSLFGDRAQRPFHVIIAINLFYWYAWAVLVPGMLWTARRYRFGRHTWLRASAAHTVGVIVFTFAHAVLTVASYAATMKLLAGRDVDSWAVFREQFFLNFDWEMMTYWAVVVLSHALDLHRESQERALAAAQLETRLAEAQFQSLQRQLHPHFLFNTLNTISALMHRDTEAADAMLERLSDLLRMTLDRVSAQLTSMKDELDFLQKYLDIERTRFGDRLQVTIDLEPDALDAAVPSFLLQPLVENALRHGIAPKVGVGVVEIVGRRVGDQLRLVVRDNGVGLPADTLNAFNGGVGLTNTRSRLEHLYGDRHRFEFQPAPGGGLAVTIVIPFVLVGEASSGNQVESVA